MMTRAAAEHVQAAALAAGDLLIWTICRNPKDYPDQFSARPHSTRAGAPIDFVLAAPTLDGVRDLLPDGLTWMGRVADDDPVIVESWV